MTVALILAAIVLAFVVGFILGVRFGAQQTVEQVRTIARKTGARSLASGEMPEERREPGVKQSRGPGA